MHTCVHDNNYLTAQKMNHSQVTTAALNCHISIIIYNVFLVFILNENRYSFWDLVKVKDEL